jgi:uncharacterized SAM-binding protein YcdF (DUF218 family)
MMHPAKLWLGGGILLGILLLLVVTHSWWLTAMAKWLVISEPVVPVDAIVVSTGSLERIEYAIQLWEQGVAPAIFIPAPDWQVIGVQKSIGELAYDEMRARGIPDGAIVVDARSDSTYSDAVYSKKWAVQTGAASLLVLEDPFGMRRLRWAFKRVFADTNILLHYAAVPPELSKLHIERWWTREHELLYVFEEYIKLVFYLIKYS